MRDCDCRKPKPGMILDLARRHQIDVSKSIMIGDRPTDMEAAGAAGCQGFLYQGGSLLTVMNSALQHIANVAKTIS
jgi:D-glycero-D-manno-heptose 1,7-bisphosphate phosphatase